MLKHMVLAILVAYITYHWTDDDPFQPDMVKGLRVLVTGGSAGIGEQLAYHYARMGANLVITARREALLKKVVEKCQDLSEKETTITYILGDMSNENDRDRIVKFAVQKLGGLDQLILNHAIYDGLNFWRGSRENRTELYHYMEVNFHAHVHLWSLAEQHLCRSKHGALGIVNSLEGKVPSQLISQYTATQFAQDGFFSAIRKELQAENKNVTVTLNILGIIGTEHAMQAADIVVDQFGLNKESFLKSIQPADPAATAYEIIRATSLGETELYYPSWQWVAYKVKTRHIIPWTFDLGDLLMENNS